MALQAVAHSCVVAGSEVRRLVGSKSKVEDDAGNRIQRDDWRNLPLEGSRCCLDGIATKATER